jgi:hypothetical protein
MARTRRLAAVFSLALALATAAAAQPPPPCGPGGAFPDVPQSHPFCAWIRQMAQDQLATSCDGTNFCPDAPVTRAQLALYFWRLTRGTASSQVDADTVDGLDSSAFLLLAGGTMTGGIDMQNNLVVNVGNAGTDFLAGGGLNVAGTFAAAGNASLGDASSDTLSVGATLQGATPLVFEGGSVDAAQTSLQVTNPTADRTVTLPNATGEVSLLGQTIDSAEITDGTITFADIGANGCASNTFVKRVGSAWTCVTAAVPIAFIHTTTDCWSAFCIPNYGGSFTFLDDPSVNGNANALIFATSRNLASPAALSVDFFDLGGSLGFRWRLHRVDNSSFVAGQTYNVLVVQP